jgi:uncharacterized delta-60 repeat protein
LSHIQNQLLSHSSFDFSRQNILQNPASGLHLKKTMRRNYMKQFLVTLVLFLFFTAILQAAGELDALFGNGGKVTTNLHDSDLINAVVLQPDGKIIAAGPTVTFIPDLIPQDFMLVRYNPNGTTDPTFGSGGIVTTDILGNNDFLGDVLLQVDGKIVAVGCSHASSTDPFQISMVRYNPNGALDPTFGSGGIQLFTLPNMSFTDFVMTGALQSDGKILVAGFVNPIGTADFNSFVARFNPNGTSDPTFGDAGIVIIDFGTSVLEAFRNVAVQTDGKIVVTGTVPASGPPNDTDMVTVRFNPNGSQDPTFGTGGVVITDFAGGADTVSGLLIQPDQKIVIAGESRVVSFKPNGGTVDDDIALVRYNPNGSLDPTFGNGGKVSTDFNGGQDFASAIALQPNGKIIAAGGAGPQQTGANDFGLVRYNPNGSLDPTFGNGGLVITDFDARFDNARDVVLQPDGKIVAAGFSGDGTAFDVDFALTRYNGDIILPPSCGLYSDDFEDGVLAPDWNYVKPAWTEVGGNLEAIPTGKKAEAIATPAFAGCGTGNCTIQTTIQTAGGVSNQIFFFGWYQDKDNLVEVLMKEEQDKWVIKQIANGSVVAKEKANAIIAPNIFYDVRVAFDGTKFTLNVDGVDLISMNAGATPSGTVGYRVKKTTGRFGNICAD